MKTYTFILAVLVSGLFSINSFGQTKLFSGVTYGSEVEALGITVGAEYFVSDKISIAPDFIYYFTNKESQVIGGSEIEVKTKLWEINGNVHYYFVDNSSIGFYGLGGLNYSHVSVDFKQTDVDSGTVEAQFDMSDGEVGVNLGVGANFPISRKLTPYAELKYVAASTDQLVIGGGVKFAVGGF